MCGLYVFDCDCDVLVDVDVYCIECELVVGVFELMECCGDELGV